MVGKKVTDPNAPRKVDFVSALPALNETDIEVREKEIRNKYKKGLISLEEYETTLARLQASKPSSNIVNQPAERQSV